ncbi:MAG: GNAT family N-acetyltransferase [Bacteroidales bacterium]|nr:GNAT family N-acetyltransferase [Bacteroidales bacterium]
MLSIKQINSENELKNLTKQEIIDFLHTHLDKFRDDKVAIGKCLDYAFSEGAGKGGFLLIGYYNGKLAGVVVMNKTGMESYIPENFLVYIAVDASLRGKGIGRQLMQEIINRVDGDIKLHVEYDNPAKRLYERLGFTTKYAEMRYTKKK